MKIAVVHSFYSSAAPSGENEVVKAQLHALESAGHEVLLVAKDTDQESQSWSYPFRAAVASAGLGGANPLVDLEKFGPDIIHVHNLFPNWGTKWLGDVSAPIVATMHNFRSVCSAAVLWRDGADCSECVGGGSLNAVRHKCYRGSSLATIPLAWATRDGGKHSAVLNNASTLIALNSRSAEFFERTRPNLRVRNIPNFAGGSVDIPRPEVSNSWIFVGRFVEEKGVRWLLENWPRSTKIEFVGAGPLAGEIEAAASNEPERFGYLGKLAPDVTKLAIARARGLIIPSLWAEGIPTVALEALSAGTPLLVSSKCSSAVDLTQNAAGEIFDPTVDAPGFAKIVYAVGTDLEYRDNAKKLYAANYSEDVWIEKMQSLYAEAISGGA